MNATILSSVSHVIVPSFAFVMSQLSALTPSTVTVLKSRSTCFPSIVFVPVKLNTAPAKKRPPSLSALLATLTLTFLSTISKILDIPTVLSTSFAAASPLLIDFNLPPLITNSILFATR